MGADQSAITHVLLRGRQREVLTQMDREDDAKMELREDAGLGGWRFTAMNQGVLLREARVNSPRGPPEGEWPC